MIRNVLQQLKAKGCSDVVYSDKCMQEIICNVYEKEHSNFIADVRSSTFFAFGQAKILCKPVVLVVDECYISNCYTALMEAWMQRIKIILVSYNSVSERSILYLERCLDFIALLKSPSSIPAICDRVEKSRGTILLRTLFSVNSNDKIDYSQLLSLLQNKFGLHNIICYNATEKNLNDSKIVNIGREHKYGVFSKYIGMLMSGREYVLCIPDYLLLLESNVFCLRNIPKKFMVYVVATNEKIIERFEAWISSNQIKVVHFDMNSDCEFGDRNTCPSIVCVR